MLSIVGELMGGLYFRWCDVQFEIIHLFTAGHSLIEFLAKDTCLGQLFTMKKN